MRMISTLLSIAALVGTAGTLQAMGHIYENSCLNEGVDAAIDLMGGYRYDKVSSSVNVYDPPDNFLFSDNLNIKGLNVYEIGVGGRVVVCRQWLLRLYGNFGRIHNGKYTETIAAPGFASTQTRSNVRKGNTNDFSVGAGYLFPCGCGFGVGPVAGWSYDYLRVKMGCARSGGVAIPVLSGLSYKNRWQGPWLGVEAQYDCSNAWLSFGYEYHWSHWHASWSLDGPDVPGVAFSDRRKCNDAFGNVIFLDGVYSVCECWEIGLGFKLQYWKAHNGKLQPRTRDIASLGISPTEVDKVRSATWHSYEVQLIVGYHF